MPNPQSTYDSLVADYRLADKYQARLELLENGYIPLPTRDKRGSVKGWPELEVTQGYLESLEGDAAPHQGYKSTGIRLDNLDAHDFDITCGALTTDLKPVLDAVYRKHGAVPPTRIGNAPKWMHILAVPGEEFLPLLKTAKYTNGKATAQIEFLTGPRRMIGALGYCDNQPSKKTMYRWVDGASPRRVKHADLPVSSNALRDDLVDAFERLLESREGWSVLTPAERLQGDWGAPQAVLGPKETPTGLPFHLEDGSPAWPEDLIRIGGSKWVHLVMTGVRADSDSPTGDFKVEDGHLTVRDFKTTKIYCTTPPEDLADDAVAQLAASLGAKAVASPVLVPLGTRGKEGMLQVGTQQMAGLLIPTSKGGLASRQIVTSETVHAMLTKGDDRVEARWNILTKRAQYESLRRPWADYARRDTSLQRVILGDRAVRFNFARSAFLDALTDYARERPFSPVEEWILNGPAWDGRDRIAELLDHIEFADDDSATLGPVYIRKWLTQAVQAACGWRAPKQVPHVLTIVGPQGCGKTGFGHLLVPQGSGWYLDGQHLDLTGGQDNHDKVVMRVTRGWMTEVGEIQHTFNRASQEAIKQFLADTHNIVRKFHTQEEIEHPRATVFLGTSNDITILRDPTGSRRFWPFHVKRIVFPHEAPWLNDPDEANWTHQLWRQVHAGWQAGETWFLTDEEDQAREVQAKDYQVASPVHETLEELIDAELSRGGQDSRVTHERGAWLNIAEIMELSGKLDFHKHLNVVRGWLEREVGPRAAKAPLSGDDKETRKNRCWHIVLR